MRPFTFSKRYLHYMTIAIVAGIVSLTSSTNRTSAYVCAVHGVLVTRCNEYSLHGVLVTRCVHVPLVLFSIWCFCNYCVQEENIAGYKIQRNVDNRLQTPYVLDERFKAIQPGQKIAVY